ncbi:hypothetical protein [Flavobacterium pokkalii]|nr:hypothetical protein [Flavobacterium pokkalii]
MKKNRILVFGSLIILTLLMSLKTQAQEEPQTVYITLTTMHRNLDADKKEWMKAEQEFFDKVTSKNELIIGSDVLTHYFTENSSEILHVSAYKSWEDIEKAEKITDDLIMKAWPDEKDRKAFFEKYRSFYTPMHSDEIYVSVLEPKMLENPPKDPMVVYVRKSQTASRKLSDRLKEYNDKITFKNPFIKAYYPQRHYWGSDSRDFVEAFFFNSLADLEKSHDKEEELIKTAWPKEEDRKLFFDNLKTSFTGIHGDYIYLNVPSLAK